MREHYLKVYPCARHSHAPVDLILQLLEDNPTLHHEGVDRVVIETYETATKLAHLGRSTSLDAQMSMPYAVAAALVFGRLGLAGFDAPARADDRVADLGSRIEVVAVPDLTDRYPRHRPARVSVTLTNGTAFTREADGAKGEPYHPLTERELDAKFTALVDDVLGSERARSACDALRDASDWRSFLAALELLSTDAHRLEELGRAQPRD